MLAYLGAALKMPNPNYRRGRAFEYKVKRELEAQGSLVFRTAGSHGAADLIAVQLIEWNDPSGKHMVPSPSVSFIQAKAGKPTAADWRKLKEMKAKFGHSWCMATKEGIVEV